jgi:Ca2+-binding RTX toxin-like protein
VAADSGHLATKKTMSDTQGSPSVTQYLIASDWAYEQVGSQEPGFPAATPINLPSGYSYLMDDGSPVILYNQDTGFYGAALVASTGQVVITFEGTNLTTGNQTFTKAQLLDDSLITLGQDAPSYATALAFTKEALSAAATDGYATSDVFVTGHSLGGAEGEFVAATTGLSGATFGAPGIPSADVPATSTSSMVDYVETGDPIGNYAMGGFEDVLLASPDIVHFGNTSFTGAESVGGALSDAANALAKAPIGSVAALLASIRYALFTPFHFLNSYSLDLTGQPLSSSDESATALGLGSEVLGEEEAQTIPGFPLGQNGTIDIPGLAISAPGAVQFSGSTITISSGGQSYSLPDSGNGSSLSLQSDGQGGTLLTAGTASSGYVFAGSNGATVQGSIGSLYFVGGSGAASVTGSSGNTTLFGGSGTSVLQGGSGTNLIYGGAGASTLIAGTGASTLVGGTGSTQEFAEGGAPVVLIAGSNSSTIDGTTGTGTEQVFTGHDQALIALNAAADSMIGGSGASTVIGGAGPDVYGFINGHAGGSEVIEGLKPMDEIVFGGYAGDPITSEGVLNGSDLITLSDGTVILLQGIDHKVFGGVA